MCVVRGDLGGGGVNCLEYTNNIGCRQNCKVFEIFEMHSLYDNVYYG